MKKFKVGDKVKVLRQDGMINTYFDSIDCVFEVFGNYNGVDGERYIIAVDDVTHTQTVHEDDLAPYTAQESPQEDGEWGPWTKDYGDYISSDAQILVEFSGSEYIRHKTKKTVAKKHIEVGGSYVTKSGGLVYKCIYIEGDKAWMTANFTGPAYVWTLDGKSLSLNATWDIDFSQDPDYDRVPF